MRHVGGLRALTSRSVTAALKIIALSTLIGAGIGAARSTPDQLVTDMSFGALIGMVIAAGCATAELQLFSNSKLLFTRRLRPVVLVALRGATNTLFILLGLSLPALVSAAPPVWNDPAFAEVFAISAFIAYAFSVGIEMTRLLGPEATKALVWGRYGRAQLENRVILFADVVGSTALAEGIGQLRFHDFLRDIAQDLARPVEITRGEIHKYVGDSVIVTWPLKRGVADDACLRCAQEMIRAVSQRDRHYIATYGVPARLRIGIHCGEVAAGEIGDWKKEIAFLGDPMNTAARIEGAAKKLGVDIAMSDDLARHLSDGTQRQLSPLPAFRASGKKDELKLWSVLEPA